MENDTEARPRLRPAPIDFDDGDEYFDGLDYADPLYDGASVNNADAPPWWIVEGEKIDAVANTNRKERRESNRQLGLPAGYGTFWDHIDIDPVSVVPTVRNAQAALERRDLQLSLLAVPGIAGVVSAAAVAAAAAFWFADGSSTDRLAACATSAVVGVGLAAMFPGRRQFRPIAIVAAVTAVVGIALSALPVVHATRGYGVLIGIAFASAGLAAVALWPISRTWRIERAYWADPDEAMVGALLKFAECGEARPDAQRRQRAVAALDRAATRFELAWHREHRTGVDITDRQLRGWAGRMRAETRELQRWCAFGAPSTLALLMRTYELIQAIVNRYSLEEHEDAWVRNGSWRRPPTSAMARLLARSKTTGRYARQCVLAGLIGGVGALLLADTVWSAVPAYIGAHVSRQAGKALTFDPTLQVFVATISLSLFPVAARAFARRR